MSKKTKSQSAKEWMSKVAEIGCIACRMSGYRDTPAELHHIRETAGVGQKSSDYDVIPLCPAHHRGTMHPLVSSVHLDRNAFVAQYGTEGDLLHNVREILGVGHGKS